MNNTESEYRSSQIVVIDSDQAGQRIDNYLFNHFKGIPKTRIYKMLRKGEVRVNKGRIKPTYRIQPGDQIRLPPVKMTPRGQTVSASLDRVKRLESRIVYESDRLLVINKPSGMAVHGGSGDSFGVIEGLRSLRPDAPYLELVHRLDKHTSGCLMIAKRRSTLRHLHELLRNHTIRKIYHCWVVGNWPADLKTVEEPLKTVRFANGDRRAIVDADGKPSKTAFRILESRNNYTMLEAKPYSGRMHQIRVHCQSQHHPICGDQKYGFNEQQSDTFKRLYLHAPELRFSERPDGEIIRVHCDSETFARFPD